MKDLQYLRDSAESARRLLALHDQHQQHLQQQQQQSNAPSSTGQSFGFQNPVAPLLLPANQTTQSDEHTELGRLDSLVYVFWSPAVSIYFKTHFSIILFFPFTFA